MGQATVPETAETATSGRHDTGFIDDPRDLGTRILAWKAKGHHVLSPAIQISNFAPGYGVNASMVLLDYAVGGEYGTGTDVYFDKTTMNGRGDNNDATEQRGVSKIGLNKIAAAAGVSWVKGRRSDPLTIQNLWIYEVTGVYLAYDGTPQTIVGMKEIDYRDSSAQIGEWSREEWHRVEERNKPLKQQERQTHINGWSDRRVRNARMNGAERAETGAMERAIRTLGVKHVYTIAELRRPFVALRVCPMLDMSDPDVRRAVTQGQLGGVAKLYAMQTPRMEAFQGDTHHDYPEPRQLEAARVPERIAAPPPLEVRQPVERAQPPVQQSPAPSQVTDREAVSRGMTKEDVVAERQPKPATQAMDAAFQQAKADGPRMPAGAVAIVDARKEERKYSDKHQKAGQSFTKWTVAFNDGVEAETVFGKWGKIIDECYHDGCPVHYQTSEKTFRGTTVLELVNIQAVSRDSDDDGNMP